MFNLNLSFMNNNLIDESAEKTSLSIMNVFYCVNLILCVLAFIAALIAIFNESFGIGVCIIIPTIIYLLFVVLFDALCKTFVNISLKLDKENAILEELKRLNNYLKKEQKNQEKVIMHFLEDLWIQMKQQKKLLIENVKKNLESK